LPFKAAALVSDGGTSALAQYDFSNDAFSITFSHTRLGTQDSYGQLFGHIIFSVDQDVNYSATGFHTAIDPEGRSVTLVSHLIDYDTKSYLYDSLQWSKSTPNESLTLGLTEGDDYNVDLGSLSGTLPAGHEFKFYYAARVRTLPSASIQGATGSGNFTLRFTAVPEPSTALLLVLGLAMVAALRRRSPVSV
jgi:hypothetical protein